MSEKLYHYTKLDTLLNYILKDNTLKINPLREMNDPFDYKTRFIYTSAKSGNEVVQYPPTIVKNADTNKSESIYMTYGRALSFSVDTPNQPGYKKLNMWAHYGDNHNGCCLEFDKDVLLEKFNQFCKGKELVFYKSGNINYESYISLAPISEIPTNDSPDQQLIDLLNKNYTKIYLTKDNCWLPENEYRFICFENPQNNGYEHKSILPLYFPYNNLLTSVYLGEKVPFDEAKMVYEKLKDTNVKVRWISWGKRNNAEYLDVDSKFVAVKEFDHFLDAYLNLLSTVLNNKKSEFELLISQMRMTLISDVGVSNKSDDEIMKLIRDTITKLSKNNPPFN